MDARERECVNCGRMGAECVGDPGNAICPACLRAEPAETRPDEAALDSRSGAFRIESTGGGFSAWVCDLPHVSHPMRLQALITYGEGYAPPTDYVGECTLWIIPADCSQEIASASCSSLVDAMELAHRLNGVQS